MKTFLEVLISKTDFDANGIDNPHDWFWVEQNGVYYPKAKIDFNRI